MVPASPSLADTVDDDSPVGYAGLGSAMSNPNDLIPELRQFVAERDWAQFHDPKNLAMLLASEAGELLAEYRWIANTEADVRSHEPATRARVIAEIGDVGIALLLLCDRIGVDLLAAMSDKLAANRTKYPADKARGKAERPET